MKSFKFLPIFFIFCLVLSIFCAPVSLALDDPEISSPTAMVLERVNGEVLYAKNPDGKIYPASTTKVMTVLLAVEAVESGNVFLNDEVTASQSAMADLIAEGSTAGIQPGETMTLENLLYCAMLSSANEACNIIAEHISGSVSAFVELMNDRAAALGCTDTHFANTHGLPNDNHYMTAADFSLIALEATRHSLFLKLCGTDEITIPATNYSGERSLHNSNALICSQSMYGSSYVYEGARGIKTGHTNAAGYCLASTAVRDDLDFLVLVFGSETSDMCFRDSITLFDWAFGNFSYQEILKSTVNIASVDIALGSNSDYVNLRPSTSITALLPNDTDLSSFKQNIRVFSLENGEPVTAPITAGEVLGEVTLTRGGKEYGTVKLVASSSVDLSRTQYMKSQIRETTSKPAFKLTVLALVMLFALYIAWVISYRVKRIKYLKANKSAVVSAPAAAVPANAPAPAQAPVKTAAAPSPAPAAPKQSPLSKLKAAATHPAAQTAPAADGDLLRQAVKVAELPPESGAEATERDYYGEVFQDK